MTEDCANEHGLIFKQECLIDSPPLCLADLKTTAQAARIGIFPFSVYSITELELFALDQQSKRAYKLKKTNKKTQV